MQKGNILNSIVRLVAIISVIVFLVMTVQMQMAKEDYSQPLLWAIFWMQMLIFHSRE